MLKSKYRFFFKPLSFLNTSSKYFSNENKSSKDSIDLNLNSVFHHENKSLISVFGKDSTLFLQNLTTNDINKLTCSNNLNNFIGNFDDNQQFNLKSIINKQIAQSSLFLDSKGRIKFDTIIIRSHFSPDENPEYWIEIDSSLKNELLSHLLLYKLRKEVEIEDISENFSVYSYLQALSNPRTILNSNEGAVWQEFQYNVEYQKSTENSNFIIADSFSFFDPRSKVLGTRIYCNPSCFENELEKINLINEKQMKRYKTIRYLYGIAEGSEVSGLLPLNSNFQYLDSISFNKGCYLGHELTQRTYHTGVIRKKILPFIIANQLKYILYNKNEMTEIPLDSIDYNFKVELKDFEIENEKREVIGKVISSCYNFGLAMINTELMKDDDTYSIEGENVIIMDYSNIWRQGGYDSMMNKIKNDN